VVKIEIKSGFPPLAELTQLYTEYDDKGTWQGFVEINETMGQEIDPETEKPYGGLTREELEALAEFCWSNCRNWGTEELVEYYFLIDNNGLQKKVDLGSRDYAAFMELVAQKEQSKVSP